MEILQLLALLIAGPSIWCIASLFRSQCYVTVKCAFLNRKEDVYLYVYVCMCMCGGCVWGQNNSDSGLHFTVPDFLILMIPLSLLLTVSRLLRADLCPVCFTSLLKLYLRVSHPLLCLLYLFSSSCQLGCSELPNSSSGKYMLGRFFFVCLFVFQPGFTEFEEAQGHKVHLHTDTHNISRESVCWLKGRWKRLKTPKAEISNQQSLESICCLENSRCTLPETHSRGEWIQERQSQGSVQPDTESDR